MSCETYYIVFWVFFLNIIGQYLIKLWIMAKMELKYCGLQRVFSLVLCPNSNCVLNIRREIFSFKKAVNTKIFTSEVVE